MNGLGGGAKAEFAPGRGETLGTPLLKDSVYFAIIGKK